MIAETSKAVAMCLMSAGRIAIKSADSSRARHSRSQSRTVPPSCRNASSPAAEALPELDEAVP